jgi:hypothetical protein
MYYLAVIGRNSPCFKGNNGRYNVIYLIYIASEGAKDILFVL